MSISPTTPISRPPVASWELDAIGIRVRERIVALLYGGYAADGTRLTERRFDLNDDSTPTFAEFVTACPAGPNFKRQAEAFGATLHPDLAGTVN